MSISALTRPETLRAAYAADGFVVVEDAIPDDVIDDALAEYERLKAGAYHYRSQSTNRPERMRVDEHGFIVESILHPLLLMHRPRFVAAAERVICHRNVSAALRAISQRSRHHVWQSMFFDRSTGTAAHQDHYYLDSDPIGHLVAVWYALEDIRPGAGPFFVVPGSHRGPLLHRSPNRFGLDPHEEYKARMNALIAQQRYEKVPMHLPRGAVLLWHPALVHGAFANQDPSRSRKSFTCHFLPEGFGRLEGAMWPRVAPSAACQDILLPRRSWPELAMAHLRQVTYPLRVALRGRDATPAMEMRTGLDAS